MEEIVLLHTNDLHSHLEKWPKMRRYLNAEKAQLESAGKTVITLELGDFVDQAHPLSEATRGKAGVDLMNQVAYDAATIGNNEGVGLPKKDLDNLYEKANFPVIIDNLIDPQTQKAPVWSEHYHVITSKGGTKIVLIALTAPFFLTYTPNGWWVQDVDDVMPQLLAEVAPLGDVIVLMSHLGIDVDRSIAEKYPEIKIVLGSHTHHLFEHGERHGEVLLAAAGKFGRYIGKVSLKVADGKIIDSIAEVIPTDTLTETDEDAEEIQGYLDLGQELLQKQIVADVPFDLVCDWEAPNSLADVTFKAIKERSQTELAVLNNGLFLEDIPAGYLNNYQLHQTLPHPMHLIKVTLNGADFLRLMGEFEKNRGFVSKFQMRGCGFRGKYFGKLLYDGIAVDPDSHEVLVQGQPVDLAKEYTLVTVDHLMFVPFFPTIELVGKVEFIFPEFLRKVLGDYLQSHYPIH